MMRLFVSSFLMILAASADAQVFISGRVVDKDSGEGVAYANISVSNAAYGTSSDENGKFFIRIEDESLRGSMKISSIGYCNVVLPLDSLAALDTDNLQIKLRPQTVLLDEVLIGERALDPESLARQAIAAVSTNYNQNGFNFEMLSVMSVRDTLKTHFTRECVLKVYRNGYVAEAVNYSKILQTRSSGHNPLGTYVWEYKGEKKNVFHYWPAHDIFLADLLASGPQKGVTVFNPSTFKRLHFSFKGFTVLENDTVSILRYGKKKEENADKERYSGLLYISVKDLAIVKHEIQSGSNDFSISYKKHDGLYYPYLIKTTRPVHWDRSYRLVHEMKLTKIITENTEVITHDPANWFPEDVRYDADFWESHYPLTDNVSK